MWFPLFFQPIIAIFEDSAASASGAPLDQELVRGGLRSSCMISKLSAVLPLSSNSLRKPNKTCPDSTYKFHHRTEWPQWQSSTRGRFSKLIRFHGTNNPFPFFRSRRILGVFSWSRGSRFVSTCIRKETTVFDVCVTYLFSILPTNSRQRVIYRTIKTGKDIIRTISC